MKVWLTSGVALLLSLALLFVGFPTGAQSGPIDLTKWTADGGAGTSSAGDYDLSGTIGQTDAGVMAGGDYTLYGGFWTPRWNAARHFYYLPLVMRSP